MLSKEEYEAKRQRRYERLLAVAERAQREGNALWDDAKQMASIIPMGQPILVGHHSEKAARRYRERIDGKRRRGYDLLVKADMLKSRAEAARRNTTIFSDDPCAAEKIEAKIERLETRQEFMKQANKFIRAGDTDGLLEMGFTQEKIDVLMTPDWCGRVGFADYQLSNNNANIRRLKQRLAKLEREHSQPEQRWQVGDVEIVDSPDDNRLQVWFPDKPNSDVRDWLKGHGFRWARSVGCWQAYRSARQYVDELMEVLKQYYGG